MKTNSISSNKTKKNMLTRFPLYQQLESGFGNIFLDSGAILQLSDNITMSITLLIDLFTSSLSRLMIVLSFPAFCPVPLT
jgi:hypothetical protein